MAWLDGWMKKAEIKAEMPDKPHKSKSIGAQFNILAVNSNKLFISDSRHWIKIKAWLTAKNDWMAPMISESKTIE